MMFAWMHLHGSITLEESTFSYHSIGAYCNRAEKRQAMGSRRRREGGKEGRGGPGRSLCSRLREGAIPCLPAHFVALGGQALLGDFETACVSVL